MFDIHRRTRYLLAAVIVGQILLISVQVQSASGVRVIESVTFGVFSQVQRAVSSGVARVRAGWNGYVALRDVSDENVRLKQEVGDLRVRLQEQRALARRSESLHALLAMRHDVELPTLGAEVIAGDATPWFRTLTINRGVVDGIQPDLAVIAPEGVVGRVVGQPVAYAAKVQLVIDRNAAVGAMVERSRAIGVVNGGAGSPALRLDFVSNLSDVDVGDRVVTSGIEGIYPKGFVIGYVERVEEGRGLYQSIAVSPAVDFDGLEDVLVVMVPPMFETASEGRR